jgi:glycerol-3-phosphate acyltransferase PlsY
MIDYLILVPIGYLIGSVPFGLVVGWIFRRVDVRRHGSGRTGMTNVLRTAGLPAGILVLALDMAKGAGVILLARAVSDSAVVHALTGVAAICGHIWPVYVGFKGGRGTACGWGGLFVLSPLSGLIATVIGLGLIGATRYMSLGSILGATSGSVALIVLSVAGFEPLGYFWYGLLGAPLIVFSHRDNINRLRRGEERRVGQAEPAAPEASPAARWPRSV